ncbi:hypothetical protein [Neptunitalea lumnitzerae]|uniref:Natural product n=1 Tax=Neptunitalea lumnitzerae TaxID=2965509 RepID=A0ABQ5MJT3_9FLAO|nr:hypothetical protein [Neptunitalea sp. Y10]GLB49673.1 hypothetical protein Y10_20410 [Neptunitalea sp. Y10]
MKKLLNLGQALSKEEQRSIQGGVSTKPGKQPCAGRCVSDYTDLGSGECMFPGLGDENFQCLGYVSGTTCCSVL